MSAGRTALVTKIQGGLVVSCQAHGDHPLRDPTMIAALARCAETGGASAIRADGPEDVKRVSQEVSVPVIGIYKVLLPGNRYFITPDFGRAEELVKAGADAVALEATRENKPDDTGLGVLIREIHERLEVAVIADVSTAAEGLRAWNLGADLVATTLSGYTADSPARETPDYELVSRLAERGVLVVAEGHVRSPVQVGQLLECGAHAVVVGTAITDPISITSWFVEPARDWIRRKKKGSELA